MRLHRHVQFEEGRSIDRDEKENALKKTTQLLNQISKILKR